MNTMSFREKLKNSDRRSLWDEYCGFLDLSLEEYMQIQNRLMTEQMELWSRSALGQKILDGRVPQTIEEFRKTVPLTTYWDYADILLQKKKEMLPGEPIVWIETTWEGGRHPIKVAPYTKGMLETYQNNLIAVLMMSTSTGKGRFNVNPGETVLYGLAPLPYPTGLIPLALDEEIGLEFLPHVKDAVRMSFSERNKKGFEMGLVKGIDYFFGMGSVAYFVSTSLAASGGSSKGFSKKSVMNSKVSTVLRLLRAKQICKKEERPLRPKDIFHLKGFVCAGTDNWCYKDELEELWGVRPMELFSGTEPSCIGTETWNKNGLYFFPDACFYEFIPEDEMNISLDDPDYAPRTCLMNEVVSGEKYELVISVLKGGAFARYRVGDTYRCLGLTCTEDDTRIPRFQYLDRVPTVIDIAGFTRITENSIASVMELSHLPVENWAAAKEYADNKRPLLHLYVEIKPDALISHAVTTEILKEHLSVYFKYIDHDYNDLKKLLGIDPLKITVLKCGTFAEYFRRTGRRLRHINPSTYDLGDMLRMQNQEYRAVRRFGL